MTGAIKWALGTYGQDAVCFDRSGQNHGKGRAIVMPMAEEDWQYTAGALGSYCTDRFLCLAQPELPIGSVGVGGWLSWGGGKYEVMAVRPIWVAGRVTHLWAILRPLEEAAP